MKYLSKNSGACAPHWSAHVNPLMSVILFQSGQTDSKIPSLSGKELGPDVDAQDAHTSWGNGHHVAKISPKVNHPIPEVSRNGSIVPTTHRFFVGFNQHHMIKSYRR